MQKCRKPTRSTTKNPRKSRMLLIDMTAVYQTHLIERAGRRTRSTRKRKLISMFGIDYVAEATPDLLRQMISAIVKKENIKGLSATYDSLAGQYPLTVNTVAEAAK